jgi:hypothetical protein
MNIIQFIKNFFTEPDGTPSSKRLVGIIGGLSLITYMFIFPSDGANNSVLIMSLGALGITGFEAIFKKQK